MKHPISALSSALRTAGAVALPLALLTLAGCTKELKWELVQNHLRDGVKMKTGLVLGAVECPLEPRKIRVGDEFDCIGRAEDDGNVTLHVKQTGEGKVEWTMAKLNGLLDMQPAEEAVKFSLESNGEIIVGVSCGPRWQAGKPGDRFDCTAEFGRWYDDLAGRIAASEPAIVEAAGREWFEYAAGWYRELAGAVRDGVVGGAIVYASASRMV